ncbi:hypothetical protein GGD83_001348 [Rhodoblastus sphagnicola]|uniref:hypothetical protein n=1 Tax=Rhodoblastus sphagnicola TaxID=333368 RepID=UPI0013048C7C|nr:hypothetical protein [Rhodoblastus sphagnicola]MBB4197556.1 hypothetical protein [Rhodoblastus sphagnicola]
MPNKKFANVNENRTDLAKAALDTFRDRTGTDSGDAIGDLSGRNVTNFNSKPFLDGSLQRFQIEESDGRRRCVALGAGLGIFASPWIRAKIGHDFCRASRRTYV